MQNIKLSENHRQILSEHASKSNPNEACALLFGKIDDNTSIVKELFLTENAEESPVNFTISDEELIKGYNIAEQKNLDVVGIFHSHPSSDAYPSETDKKFMQSNPVVWIIYSEEYKEFRAFILDSEIFEIQITL